MSGCPHGKATNCPECREAAQILGESITQLPLSHAQLYQKNIELTAELAQERERVAELEAALQAAVDDLLLRGRKDPDGTTVVNIGFSVWLQMRKALAPPTDTTGGEG